MALVLYDTLTRRKRPFAPLEPGRVRMYHCGPTVYSRAHIGNFRAFVLADVLRRWMECRGHEVIQVMNITDVGHLRDDDPEFGEDKMEAAARREQLDPWKIAEKYTELFLADVDKLGLKRAHHYPRATDHIPQMIALVQQLLASGHAYEAGGHVYFSVQTFPTYGRLSGNAPEDLVAGARVEVALEKRDPRDFALWKREPHHVMQWDSPFGRGFPGWHLECSAMGMELLGETFDIHTGGEDNIFPHHESEIAQSEAATGKPFVRTWMHTRFLQVDGGKMSKSLGNLFSVDDIEQRGFPAVALRYLLLRGHYRQTINFTWEGLEQAAAAVRRLRLFAVDMEEAADGAAPAEAPAWVSEAVARFEQGMDDDLNLSAALDGVFSLLHEAHRAGARGAQAAAALAALRGFDRMLGVLPEQAASIDEQVEALIARRGAARVAKDWATADAIRDELAALGVELLDSKDGVKWRRTGVQG